MSEDLICDFVFVPDGAPWPADWVRRHPDYITLPAQMRQASGPGYGQPQRYEFPKSAQALTAAGQAASADSGETMTAIRDPFSAGPDRPVAVIAEQWVGGQPKN